MLSGLGTDSRSFTARGVRAESGAGGGSLENVSGELRVLTGAGSILAELPVGTPLMNSTFQTAAGDIRVCIPSNLAVRVQAMNRSARRMGRIISEWPEIRARAGDTAMQGPTVAEGVLNGGGPLLKLAAMEGTMYLRRSK